MLNNYFALSETAVTNKFSVTKLLNSTMKMFKEKS